MKKALYISFIILCAAISSCSKGNSGSVILEDEGIFVFEYGATGSTTFTHSHMSSFGVLEYPEGWIISVSLENGTISATAPADATAGADQGEVTLLGFDDDGSYVYAYLIVAKTDFIALDDPNNDRQANCMILTEPNKIYTFNANRRGEETTEQTTKAASVEMVWRSSYTPVGYPTLMDDGSVSVYTIADVYDYDDDDDYNEIVEGNAVVATYDSRGNLLWSWHLWVTANDPTITPTTINGVEFMSRNIGAAMNSISSEDDILSSYGLYYQWGRKDPFIYPYYFNAASSSDALIYDADGNYITHELIERSSATGTVSYAQSNPLNFIIEQQDWLATPNDTLWGSGTTKSVYDPSPKGWRVPSSAELNLSWSGATDPTTTYGYGAMLDGELFMALGRKVYYDGTTQNVSEDGTYQPFAGYYWSRDAVAGTSNASSLLFYLNHQNTADTTDDTVTVESGKAMGRANGMQIRPVRNN